jgi:hypothetical protein
MGLDFLQEKKTFLFSRFTTAVPDSSSMDRTSSFPEEKRPVHEMTIYFHVIRRLEMGEATNPFL